MTSDCLTLLTWMARTRHRLPQRKRKTEILLPLWMDWVWSPAGQLGLIVKHRHAKTQRKKMMRKATVCQLSISLIQLNPRRSEGCISVNIRPRFWFLWLVRCNFDLVALSPSSLLGKDKYRKKYHTQVQWKKRAEGTFKEEEEKWTLTSANHNTSGHLQVALLIWLYY